jgi:hypothetical protein
MTAVVLPSADMLVGSLDESDRARLRDLIARCTSLRMANQTIHRLTGIREFLADPLALTSLSQLLAAPIPAPNASIDRQWGDFQTPLPLATQICHYLAELGTVPTVIIEPTCGVGNFIYAALDTFPSARLIYGIEIQDQYQWALKLHLLAGALKGKPITTEIELHQDDIFMHRFPARVLRAENILILGNPPWVTNAELGGLESRNLPVKRNIKGLSGLDALTGKSNFDISEYILLHLLELFSERRGRLALLCKNAVVRNLVKALPQRKFKIGAIRSLEIDARQYFGAAVEASLLVIDLGTDTKESTCRVSTLDRPDQIRRTFGWLGPSFVADVKQYHAVSQFDGKFPWPWRHGVKHDCAAVMELEEQQGCWTNGTGEKVTVEPEWVYWLLKSSDLRTFEVTHARKKIILTQRKLGEDPTSLQMVAPRLWQYLLQHAQELDRRKSSIYRQQPRFALFGIGDYAFKLYKVAIAGLYKEPCFSLVAPIGQRPVMLDDTCYYLGFDDYADALFTASLLNSQSVKDLLQSIVFTDAKRPYTKDVLMRIALDRIAEQTPYAILQQIWSAAEFKPAVSMTESDYLAYQYRMTDRQAGGGGQQMRLTL